MLGMNEEEHACLVCSFIALNRAEFQHHLIDKHKIQLNVKREIHLKNKRKIHLTDKHKIQLKDKYKNHLNDKHKIQSKDKHKSAPKTFQDQRKDIDDGDVLAPAVQIFFGDVKEEELSESEINNDFEEYDNEMDNNEADNGMDSDDGEDNGLDNEIGKTESDEPIDNANDSSENAEIWDDDAGVVEDDDAPFVI